ncbi:tryptophan halogenase family protein [Thalassotalea litorea]|uniref:tryptophan halogenase family protein n=1 Tax=Thalassotalea litorea TaxID=2020715 RepID=UPI003735A095
MNNTPIQSILIVGGGSAGWLTAGILAATHQQRIRQKQLTITLVESADIATIGVGEGTWPTMPDTMQKLGIDERDLFRHVPMSFKQGSQFINWHSEHTESSYLHPFDVPPGAVEGDLSRLWLQQKTAQPFSQYISIQHATCALGLAPKTTRQGSYDAYLNYGYHLDARAFAKYLKHHCMGKLGVEHRIANIKKVNVGAEKNITSLDTDTDEQLHADLFIDCSGIKALLLGQALSVKNIDVSDTLFCDRALTAQIPEQQSPIASVTRASAQTSGWIWDIPVPQRRGIGHVYSSRHMESADALGVLEQYIRSSFSSMSSSSYEIREIAFNPGYKEQFWLGNCLAIGLSAGFIEPLEASALVMIELSANMLAEQLPVVQSEMPIIAKRFNQTFHYRWQRVIEFLKLHYVLSERQSRFWLDHRDPQTIPERLKELLQLWRHRVPSLLDFDRNGEIFQAASYQYVLYGSGYPTQLLQSLPQDRVQQLLAQIETTKHNQLQLQSGLPRNRQWHDVFMAHLA